MPLPLLYKSSMNTASLRTYIYKGLILGLVPVLAIVSLSSTGLTAPAKAGKPQTPVKSSSKPKNIRAIDRTTIPQGAFADSYTLGPGDRLRVDIFNVPEYSGEFPILADGSINLPVIGSVPVQGQTIQRASSLLTGYFSRYVKRPLITISLLAPRPVQVSIAGEISRAGSYTVPFTLENRKFPTVGQIIQLAGGTNQTANLRQVQVRRASTGRVVSVNIFDVLQRGNTSQDISLRDGDTIFIPRSENVSSADLLRVSGSNLANQDTAIKVAIVGEVGKPGTYTLKGESTPSATGVPGRVSPPTLTEAIKIAGGSTASADLTKIRVRRNTRTGAGQTVPINLLSLLQSGDFSQDIVLQDGDTVVLPTSSGVGTANSSLIAASNLGPQSISPVKVVVVGEVNRPGTYTVRGDANTTNNNTQLTGNVTLPTVTQAIQAAAGIKPTADIRQVQLIRTTRTGEQKIALNLFNLLQKGDTNQDIILQEGDRIFIPLAQNSSPQDVDLIASSTFSPATIKVNVIGEISTKFPKGQIGSLDMPPNTTLNQAILIAGGFDNVRANKSEVDFIRLNPNGTVTKRLIKLNFAKGIDGESNPRLQNNDTIVIGRSNLTRIGDGFSSILSPFNGLFGFFNIFR
jgi:polysaccharide biosynthesis/export protein